MLPSFFVVLSLPRPRLGSIQSFAAARGRRRCWQEWKHCSDRGLNFADTKVAQICARHAVLCFSLFSAFSLLGWGVGGLDGWGRLCFGVHPEVPPPNFPARPTATNAIPRAEEGNELQAQTANQVRLFCCSACLRPAVAKRAQTAALTAQFRHGAPLPESA